MSQLVDVGSLSPTAYINRKIRTPNGDRILDLTKALAHNLKQETAARVIAQPSGYGHKSHSQTEIGNFDQVESANEASGKKDKISSPDGEDSSQESDEHQSDSESTDETKADDQPTGLIYARVSSDGQIKSNSDGSHDSDGPGSEDPDKGSIQGQIFQLEQTAKENEITLPYDPITDEAETGTNFDREGIERVFNLSKQNDIDYLLVEKVDRVGRSAPETLYFIWLLQNRCGVTLYTLSGKQDIDEIEALMQMTLYALIAEVENDIRTSKATNERIRGFLERKDWNCKSPIIPLGYSETDDGWLEVDPDEKPIIRELFEKFVECETYSETERHINSAFGKEALSGHKVKTILQRSCYIGRPRIPEEWIKDTQFDNHLEEEQLNLLSADVDDNREVSEEIFDEAQQIIEGKEPDTDPSDKPYAVSDFVDEFGLFAVVSSSSPVKLVHHCGEPMVKNGQVDIGGKFDMSTHRYKCQSCDEVENREGCYGKWPTQNEAEKMELVNQILDDDFSLYSTD